jgi:uncharacterized protein YecT (DUF1311 family)
MLRQGGRERRAVILCRNPLLVALFVLAWLPAERGYAGSTHRMSQEYDACIARANGVTAEVRRCANNELQRQKVRLNRALVMIRDSARISIRRKHELESQQNAWEISRNKDCMAEAQRQADGGSTASVIATDCAIFKTAERADQLEAIARE